MIKYKWKEVLPKKMQNLQISGPIQDPKIHQFVDLMQRIIEGRFFDMRKSLYEYSSFVELQRLIFQGQRQDILLHQEAIYNLEILQGAVPEVELFEKIRQLVLFQYDKYWADYLDYLAQLREGIHLVRLGGQQPLREFRKKADEAFHHLQERVETAISEKVKALLEKPDLDLTDLGVNPPTSTWTYVINDNPFSDQLSIMLLDNSNVGLTVDPISALFLFIFSLFKKKVR